MSAHISVTTGSYRYVDYSGAPKKLLREASVMEEMKISPASVFVKHGYVQHSGSQWRGHYCTRYHSHLILENHALQDEIPLAYEESSAVGSGESRVVFRKKV